MAKASVVSAQQHQQLEEINAKLDLLLKAAGLTFNAAQAGEAPKPTKFFAKPAAASVPAVAPEPEPAKASKRRNG